MSFCKEEITPEIGKARNDVNNNDDVFGEWQASTHKKSSSKKENKKKEKKKKKKKKREMSNRTRCEEQENATRDETKEKCITFYLSSRTSTCFGFCFVQSMSMLLYFSQDIAIHSFEIHVWTEPTITTETIIFK